jgi:hypothetical protein
MKLILTTILFFGTLLLPMMDISMFGLKVGDSKNSMNKIKLKVVAKDGEMIKYQAINGNAFSVTCENGKVVYMENDWLQDTSARQPLFSNFKFGQTTLRDIRKKFGTNGFTYEGRQHFDTQTDLIEFNYFEFNSPNNELLITITKIPLVANVTEENVADNLKLDAIIIADKFYCDRQWGKKKLYDENYKKINP